MKKILLCCAALAVAASPAFAQTSHVHQTEATQVAAAVAPAIEKVEVNQDGSLTGKVFAKVSGQETPVDAKVTLASEGVVIEAVQTENGSFSFANIAPGSYTLTGSTPGFAGGQAFDVAPYAGTGCSSCSLGLQSTSAWRIRRRWRRIWRRIRRWPTSGWQVRWPRLASRRFNWRCGCYRSQ